MSRSRLSAAIGGLVLCVLAADSAVLARRQRAEAPPALPLSVLVEQRKLVEKPADATARAAERATAIKELFGRRGDAILRRDRAAFLATLDPEGAAYREDQNGVFDALSKLEFAEFRYTPRGDESYSPAQIEYEHYKGAHDLWLPVLTMEYQLKGFDVKPVARRVVYTVVRRGEHWYVADDADLEDTTSSGTSVRVDPWENGPIVVARGKHGLVIGHPEDEKAVAGILREVESAVRHVSSYVGRSWGEKVVVVLPTDKDELDRVLENPDSPYDFAAVARPLTTVPGEDGRELAGARVVINPEEFDVGDGFTRLLIRHEITHVATFGRNGPLTPKWLIEGLAEYVGNAGAEYSTARLGAALGEQIEREGVPNHLPLDSDFGLINDASVGYNSGWLLCRYIASKYGRKALLKFYDAMGDEKGLDRPGDKLDTTLRAVLRTSEAALLKAWRPYVRAAVGDLADVLVKPGGSYKEDDVGEVDATDIALEHDLPPKRLEQLGVERGAEGFWYTGSSKSPSTLVVQEIVVARDEPSAEAARKAMATPYARFDPAGRPIPNGHMYFIGIDLGGAHYNQTVAIMRVGIMVIEVRVAVPGFGDPSGEARRLAQRQYAAAVSVA